MTHLVPLIGLFSVNDKKYCVGMFIQLSVQTVNVCFAIAVAKKMTFILLLSVSGARARANTVFPHLRTSEQAEKSSLTYFNDRQ